LLGALSYADVLQDIKNLLHIDFLAQFEEYVIEAVTGINESEGEDWFHSLAYGLENCASEIAFGPHETSDPHCWVYYQTKAYHVEVPFSSYFVGHPVYPYEFFLPDLLMIPRSRTARVGEENCYGVESRLEGSRGFR
jgi:hypothetical protein